MIANSDLLNHFWATGQIHVQRGALFACVPRPLPLNFDFDRVAGMLLGLAIGDALGNTTESQNSAARRARYGEIQDYLPNRYAGGRAVGLPSEIPNWLFGRWSNGWSMVRSTPNGWRNAFAQNRFSALGRRSPSSPPISGPGSPGMPAAWLPLGMAL